MRTPLKTHSFVAAVIVLMSCMLSAQEPLVDKVRFRTIGGNCDLSGLNYLQANEDKPVLVQLDTRSVFHEYKGGNNLVFYRIQTGADGTPLRIPAAEANLKAGGSWPLLIFFRDPATPDRFRIQVTPDDPASFPVGSYKFINYSNQAVTASVGPDSLGVIPGQTGLLMGRIDPQKRTNFTQIRSEGRNGKLFYSNNWAVDATLRTMVFINQNRETGSPITVKRLTDRIEAPAESPK